VNHLKDTGMLKLLSVIFFCLLTKAPAFATQTTSDSSFVESQVILHTATGDIFGSLIVPLHFSKGPVALIIAGSGATDRNGNNPQMKNESLRMLAHGLASNRIASLRFDKRAIGESRSAAKNEKDLRFEDYINDVKGWITYLKEDKRFSKIIVIGHSEGSLIGMISSQTQADAFVSVAGAGKSADKLLKEQLTSQPQQIKDLAFPILDSLALGLTVTNVSPLLYSLFRPSLQPYMISWFRYDPQVEIKKLGIPVLIIQGTNDIQIPVQDAEVLAKANAKGKLVLIDQMNHVLKIVSGDRKENIAAYSNPALPLSIELIKSIVAFINMK
jgi:pimeloyl-ACP methyl ester carboxylesterase